MLSANMHFFLLSYSILYLSCSAFPILNQNPLQLESVSDTDQIWSEESAIRYLEKFGYLTKSSFESSELSPIIDRRSYEKALRKFQKMMGLSLSGELDAETIEMMKLPRCGVEDTSRRQFFSDFSDTSIFENDEGINHRSKRYALHGTKWNKNKLKYHILNYTPDLTHEQVRISIKRAFELWSNHTNLEFIFTNNEEEADIKISFVEGDHGDFYPFDGPGGELAHAYYPSDGRAHFDDAERFTFEGNARGIDLFTVAAHEFGHSLGLGHSTEKALMAPVYKGYKPNLKLEEDDINGIQKLYGKKLTPSEDNSCPDRIAFDTMFYNYKEKVLYAFKKNEFWKIGNTGILPGYPKLIQQVWERLPSDINASAYSKTTGRTYFFKGNKVWRYGADNRLEKGFPQPASALGLPASPDAAVQWKRDGMVYIFKDDKFYRFSEYQHYNGRSRSGKWSTTKYWKGIPSRIDSVVHWKDGKIYFVKDDYVWRFAHMGKSLDKRFPKSIQSVWLKCGDSNDLYPERILKHRNKRRHKNGRRKHRPSTQ